MILDTTTKKIQVVLGEAISSSNLDYVTCYSDITTSAFTPISSDGVTNGVTPVDIVSAPASSTQRVVDLIQIDNIDTISHVVSIIYDNNGTQRILTKITLQTNEVLIYNNKHGWTIKVADGSLKKGNPTYLGSSFMPPVQASRGVALSTSPSPTWSIFQYLGQAAMNATTVKLQFRVIGAATTITWTELAVFKADPASLIYNDNNNACMFTFTRLGFSDMSSVWNTIGLKTVSITASVTAGDHLWAVFGDNSSGSPQFRASEIDDIDINNYTQVSNFRPSTVTVNTFVPKVTGNIGVWVTAQLS